MHEEPDGPEEEAGADARARVGILGERGGFLLRRMHQIWSSQIQRRFHEAGYDVTSVQFAALDMIVRCEGLDQTDLSLRIGYDRTTTSGVIMRLVNAGFVERAPDPNDRRARILTATPAGRAAAGALERIARETDAELTAPLGPEGREALYAGLLALVEAGNARGVAPEFNPHGRDGARDGGKRAPRV